MSRDSIPSRRKFLKYTGAASGLAFIAGCSGQSGGSEGGGSSGGSSGETSGGSGGGSSGSSGGSDSGTPTSSPTNDLNNLHFGMVPAESTDAPQVHLVSKYMQDKFDQPGTIDFMENNSLITQSLVARQINVGGGGYGGTAALVGSGKDISLFGVHMTATDYVLVGQPGYESLKDVVNEDARVAIGSPTGLETVQTAGLLFQEGLINDMSELQLQQIGFSSSRMTAMLKENPPVDVSPQHYNQWIQMKDENPDLNLIVEFGGAFDRWIQDGWFARNEFINNNVEELANLIAAEVLLHREILEDWDLYKDIINQYVPGGGPPTETLRTTWEFLTKNQVWPKNLEVFNKETVSFMNDVVYNVGITDKKLSADAVINTKVRNRAQEKLKDM